jgi:IS605 OrfB family transposase
MPQQNKPPVTKRAYTLRLRGTGSSDDLSWRRALWQTHEAVNKGARVFGGWLLTLRGGLDHTLADAAAKGAKEKAGGDPASEERKARRILLALSWLSVESKLGAPAKYIIPSGKVAPAAQNGRVVEALEEILKSRDVPDKEIEEWKNDCQASLSAAIRDDAVWVNRSKAFDEAVKLIGCSLTRDEVWDMLERFFGSRDAYLAPAKGSEDESSETEQEEKAKELVKKAGQWLSSRFGTGKGADFSRIADVCEKIAAWAEHAQADTTGNEAINSLAAALSENDLKGVLHLISGPGYKSATRNLLTRLAAKVTVTQQDLAGLKDKATSDAQKCKQKSGSKGQRPYADAILKDVESVCGFTYRVDQDGKPVSVKNYSKYDDDYSWGSARHPKFAVILDHAARRVSLAHTWIKRAEAKRRRLEEDAKKIGQVPENIKKWLNHFCSERSQASGALEPYRIRRRAVDGWKEVVAEWSKSSCSTSTDRIAAARALQDDPEIYKFGDIQLFEALAEKDAECVWHKDGDTKKAADPQPLIDYVLAAEAEFKSQHFKVPAYRHPDALLHPIFCDFGESRWDICFDVHKNVQTHFARALCLTLWTGSGMAIVPLCWQSKRLARDLALGQGGQKDGASEVTRADRLGRAASNVTKSDEVKISGLFEQADWNGRLQAPRQQLEAISRHVEEHGWDEKTTSLRDRIQWLVTFSAKLQPQGPWCEFAKKLQLISNPQYWSPADTNKNRKGHARLILSRLPGLRVLSVDLGHRYAAACAVWEAVNAEQVKRACLEAGHEEPKASDLYLHLKRKVTKQKKGNQVEIEKTTIYRRIGADTLPDGTPHPAPWARLDRQFLIKLQGEEEEAREASNEEIWAVHQLEADLGRTSPLIDRLVRAGWGQSGKQKARLDALRELGWKQASEAGVSDVAGVDEGGPGRPSLAIDELMSSAAGTMRLALKRHGDRARIAFAMAASENERIESIQDALMLWHGLTSSRGWRDEAAEQLWDDHIATLPPYNAPETIDEKSTGPKRKKKQEDNREKFHNVAEALAKNGELRAKLHEAFEERWKKDDERWKKQLRWFKDWVLPRGKHAGDPTIRKVGGLSLFRLATLTEFRRKFQVGFFTRLQPDGTKAETRDHFGQRALEALEHLREQRVKQLASRLAEAALGIGRVKRPMGDKDAKRPNVRVDEPCHAVVIEDLTHYRPEQTRTRRENRQLMTWSASKVKKYLSEACELHGLHLREVPAGYTSRQDSRTGAPGIRCQDVPVYEFMRSPFWKKKVEQSLAKLAGNKDDALECFLCDLNEKWKCKSEADRKKAGVVRVPSKGGDIFVSADSNSPAAKGLQADLNAAANIGLRALADPDWPGKWWYVPCDPASFKPVPDKAKGSAAISLGDPLKCAAAVRGDGTRKKPGKAKSQAREVVNLWRDASSSALTCTAAGEWREYAGYQKDVQSRVMSILKEQMKEPGGRTPVEARDDDVPF